MQFRKPRAAPQTGVECERHVLKTRITPYHAKYYAFDLTRRAPEGLDRLSSALFDASVDLNPHQIEAALFALESPLSNGALLADEVGLGKTIEAGIVLCQFWAERRRRLLVICPASLRKQWALELEEKFNLPAFILDAKSLRQAVAQGRDPLSQHGVTIISMPYAARLEDRIHAVDWDLVVIDEAHKLRNAYRPSNRTGRAIRQATAGRRTLLLTATPLQNSLLELYGLSTLIDERLFGDVDSFRSLYTNAGGDLAGLRRRLSSFVKRTLRNQVIEYIRYTDRLPITVPFSPTDHEQALYEAVTDFLERPDSYALPERQRHLTALIVRKLLASSPVAIAATLDTLRLRLEAMRDNRSTTTGAELAEMLIAGEEVEEELLEEFFGEEVGDLDESPDGEQAEQIDRVRLAEEIVELDRLAGWARSITEDTKARALLTALSSGFAKLGELGAQRKALVFTESRRTQDYLAAFVASHGYDGRVVVFNGTNSGPDTARIYQSWLAQNADSGRVTGSRDVDVRTALIEHFRDHADVMIATEAGAEGINMQFCSLVVNYDLPWNPQRIEQRIGRCHRYGQKHDVVVVNFLNERNDVDRRVLQLLSDKFRLFSGVFGASDDVLGAIESGVDFEHRILEIYEQCRTAEEIDAAFARLQSELDEQIRGRLDDTRKLLLEHFDEDVHERLRLRLADTQAQLDRVGRRFWSLTRFMLESYARFSDGSLTFDLLKRPYDDARLGRYHLISKNEPSGEAHEDQAHDAYLYRLSHPLGEHVIERAKDLPTPQACIEFDVTGHPARISSVEALRGRRGYLTLQRLSIDSYELEEHLLFTAVTDAGETLDAETAQKLFAVGGRVLEAGPTPQRTRAMLEAESRRHADATISRSLEANSRHFNEARERLEQWADDMVVATEKALKDTKEQIKALRRDARQAESLQAQHDIQQRLQQLERKQRRQRQDIFRVEDEIMERRDALIDELESRLSQRTVSEPLFIIEWTVV
ncbi:MAG: SNF2-related protein [Actinomycetota bacterium]|nr:SNF2-related protein [Actinomycetota bacterium]